MVGKLIAVAPNASRVLLINDHNSGLDAFDQRSRARGIVAGLLDGGLTMKYVDRTEDVKPGDSVVTSGMDGIFPRGLLVGQITRVSQEGPGLFLNIDIQPAADFRKLEQVLILTRKPPAACSRYQGLKLRAPRCTLRDRDPHRPGARDHYSAVVADRRVDRRTWC